MIERCGGACVRPVGHDGECRPTWHAYEPCGEWMPLARELCARRRGHTTEHRTRYSLANRVAHDRRLAA